MSTSILQGTTNVIGGLAGSAAGLIAGAVIGSIITKKPVNVKPGLVLAAGAVIGTAGGIILQNKLQPVTKSEAAAILASKDSE